MLRFGTRAQVLSVNADGSLSASGRHHEDHGQAEEVALIEETKQQAKKIIERSQHAFRNTPTKAELDLRGMSADEAVATLAVFLDSAMLANLSSGAHHPRKGNGRPAQGGAGGAAPQQMRQKFRLGVYGEGEDGVTIAELA